MVNFDCLEVTRVIFRRSSKYGVGFDERLRDLNARNDDSIPAGHYKSEMNVNYDGQPAYNGQPPWLRNMSIPRQMDTAGNDRILLVRGLPWIGHKVRGCSSECQTTMWTKLTNDCKTTCNTVMDQHNNKNYLKMKRKCRLIAAGTGEVELMCKQPCTADMLNDTLTSRAWLHIISCGTWRLTRRK